MSSRPDRIDLPPNILLDGVPAPQSTTSAHSDASSYMFSEIPPALSPLDALALQGRLLQRRFEEEVNNGRRISRLPPNLVANEIAKGRPTFFRSLSQNDVSTTREADLPVPVVTEVPQLDRRVSQHPLISGVALSGPPDLANYPPFPRPRPGPGSLDGIDELLSGRESALSDRLGMVDLSPSQIFPSPRPGHQPRSPSITSEGSISLRPNRPSYNFSRPLSRNAPSREPQMPDYRTWRSDSNASSTTRPSLDVPNRFERGYGGSPATPQTFDGPRTPNDSVTSEEGFGSEQEGANGSYIYSKYALPRGKALKRESLGPTDFLEQQINWSRQSREQTLKTKPNVTAYQPSEGPKSILPDGSPSPTLAGADKKNKPPNIIVPLQRSATAELPTSRAKSNHKSTASSPSNLTSDASTIRPSTSHSPSKTPEDHFQQGIDCHEKGSLQESTYHFRIAAKAGHSKAMLFYALACRHGWGMKPNAQEGVLWLQKAVDSSQLDIADDEDLTQRGQQPDFARQKSHKAQFALSVYELGVSYMKGWGVTQDKALGLRCFEIAGNWGDADALTEAGFCYVEGIGCKKDMKKAAGLYRQAEAKGVSMAGNSWIYKEKYMKPDEEERPDARAQDSPRTGKRSKSRSRSFFGRKKSLVPP